jgi:hypothetical protein
MTKRILGILALVGALGAASSAWAASYPERLAFDGNVLYNNMQTVPTQLPWSATSGPCTTGVAINYTTTDLGTVYFTHNKTNADPKLVDPFNLTTPRWDPQQLSPLNCKYSSDAVVMSVGTLDPWFQQTDYVGAIPYRFADPSRDWTSGWIYTNTAGGFGRTDINYAKPLIILSGPIATMTLSASNNYLLRGKVNVAPGHSLTIPAGTYLFGERATTGYLVIDRGAKIFVNGTAANPVVLTSDQDPSAGLMASGDNGGLVIHGRAIANCANTALGDSCVSEGGAGAYGGADDNDNSGSIKYMRIEYSGKTISPDNELNSLTMNAVGRNTQIDYVNAPFGSDDAFEWFGGTARCSHLVANGQDDDGLDWQLGYRGRVQFAVVQMHPGRGDKGIEADNSEFDFQARPRSNPTFTNLTLIGTNPPTAGAGTTNIGVHWRRGTGGTIVNSVILGFRGAGLTISDPETFANCPGTAPAVYCQATVSAVESQESTLPRGIYMTASPNPVRTSTELLFGLPTDQRHVRAQVFDARGRLVETIVEGPMTRGVHRVSWSPKSSLPSGNYFFRVTGSQGETTFAKLVLVR